jgi:hypothetical protein
LISNLKPFAFYLFIALGAISCHQELNGPLHANRDLLLTIKENNLDGYLASMSDELMFRVGEERLEEMLLMQFQRSKFLMAKYPDMDSYAIEHSERFVNEPGAAELVDLVETIVDSIEFNEVYYKSYISFSFINENDTYKIKSLQVMDAEETIMVQKHIKNLAEEKSCEPDCPFHDREERYPDPVPEDE